MNVIRLIVRQVRYQNKSFWRNPASAFFTFIFPLMFLVIFNVLLGNNKTQIPGGTQLVPMSNFYVPGIAAMGLISACYTNIAMGVTISRDAGLLKRIRGTPLPAGAYLLARVIHASLIGLLLVAIVTVAGALFYGVSIPTHTMPALVATLIVACAAFSALGLAVSGLVPNADAAPAVVQASILPLLFISDVFIPMRGAPHWIVVVADLFPVKHLSTSLMTAFNPFTTGSGFSPKDLWILGIWLVVGLGLASRFFSWEPRR